MKTLHAFSLAVLSASVLSGCAMASPPADLDVRATLPSQRALYLVSVRPLGAAPKMNTIHPWEIKVTSGAGVPVADARITFAGGMPQHGHGYPTAPRVTAYLGEGRYRLDGVKFSMSGWWTMSLGVTSSRGTDQVVFNTLVGTAGTPLQTGTH